MLVEEISHRVLNQYTRAISSMSLAAARATDPIARRILIETAQELRAHAEAHRALQAPRSGEMLDLGEYLGRICVAISASTLADAGIHLTLIQNRIGLSSDRCWRVGLMVSELITNARRHGLHGTGGEIVVELASSGDKIFCRVTDDGCSSTAPSMGRGRTLIETLADDLGGSVNWTFAPAGVSVLLTIPARQQ